MYGGIGDISRNYGRRREVDGVNCKAGGVRREMVWLPERDIARNGKRQVVGDGGNLLICNMVR